MSKTIHPTLILAIGFFIINLIPSAPLNAQSRIVNTIAGGTGTGFSGDGGPAVSAQISTPCGLALDRAGSLYFADELNHRIRKVNSAGLISTVAGSGPVGMPVGSFGGDGGLAVSAFLNAPFGVAVDTFGNIYIADNQNYRIRKINTSGIISTIGGNGIAGYTGDGLAATNAKIGYTHSLTIDVYGNLYFGDIGNFAVRKINTAGIITTVAGTGTSGFSGDGGIATNAKLNNPRGVKVDAAGNVYIADVGNNRVRKVDASGNINTIAGGGAATGSGVPATSAALPNVWDIALDGAGNLYVAVTGGERVRMVDPSGYIYNFSGSGALGYTGDGCLADTARYHSPRYLVVDTSGSVYVSDADNAAIRKISKNNTPLFTGGHNISLSMCMDTVLDIGVPLSISDTDANQWENWSLGTPPAHGTAVTSYFGISGGGTYIPSGMYYTPTTGFTGTDVFSVVVKDCGGASDSTTVSVTVSNCALAATAIKLPTQSLNIYPNPNNGSFVCNLTSADCREVSYIITNLLGEKIKEITTFTNTSVNIETGLPAGVYFITATTGSGNYNTRFIVR